MVSNRIQSRRGKNKKKKNRVGRVERERSIQVFLEIQSENPTWFLNMKQGFVQLFIPCPPSTVHLSSVATVDAQNANY